MERRGARLNIDLSTEAGKKALIDMVSEREGLHDGRLIIENRTDDPVSPKDGRMWLRTDL